MSRVVPRRFTQVEPQSIEPHSRPLFSFFGKAALVILGDPGAGKTTTFDLAAQEEHNAVYVSVRDFLALSPRRWEGKVLYLDGLDEQRAKTADGTAILDQVRTRLDQIGRPRFRLSCRAADWYGGSDADKLRLVSPDETVTVLRIDPLTDEDILEIASDTLPDPRSFLEQAKHLQIHELLTNPQTLGLILSVVAKGTWPRTKREVFHHASSILARESNEEHARIGDAEFTEEHMLDAAGYLCTLQLCAGLAGFSLVRKRASDDYPLLNTTGHNSRLLSLTVRRRIFTSSGTERVSPIHRTVAEYLGAKYLASKVREGFPLRRLLALITGYDGGTLADLRGLYAWLACLCPEHAGSLIPRDPLGVVLYGDATTLASSAKRLIIENLASLAKENPWFRSEKWAAQPFGGLASPDMEDDFRSILQDAGQHPVVVSCVLDAIAYGQPLPSLAEHLETMVRDNARPNFVREDALLALHNAHPNSLPVLLALLDEINAGILADEEGRLRGELLWMLYPTTIGPDRIAEYLVDEHPHFIGKYALFLHDQLNERTPSCTLPILLDSVAQSTLSPKRACQYSWQRFLGRLLVRGLTEHGEAVTVARLYNWLGLVLDEHGSSIAEEEHRTAIRQWLDQHPGQVQELFWYWLSTTPPERVWQEEHAFWERLQNADRAKEFAQPILERAHTERNNDVADFLFRTAVRLRVCTDAPSLEELVTYVEKHTRFRDALQSELYCAIPEWHLERTQRRRERKRAREFALKGRIEVLSKEIEKIRTGASGNLTFLARIYFGLFTDVDHDANPLERLTAETTQEITNAALQGFVASLRRRGLPTPEDIGKLYGRSRTYNIAHVLLAGMDIVASRSLGEITDLPQRTLGAVLAFHYAQTTGHDRPWVRYLLTSKSALSARALQAFWQPQLARKAQHIPGLYQLAHEDSMTEVAREIAVPLLGKHPRCSLQSLDNLIKGAVRHGNRQELFKLARRVLAIRGVRGAHRIAWYALAYLLKADEFQSTIDRYISRDPGKAGSLLKIAFPSWSGGRNPQISLTTNDRAFLIRVAGRTLKPRDTEPQQREPGAAHWVTQRMEAARTVASLILNLSNEVGADATAALATLGQDPSLAEWRESLRHAMAVQARRRRETQFRYPNVKEVVSTLKQGPPANAADLQATVMDKLRVLGEELQHGPTDGYKGFWNVDSFGRPTEPRPEDDCRDRILERLRPELLNIGISAEREGYYAQHKRSDIKALYGSLNLPVEIKRHYHKDLWRAPVDQLSKFYSRDPGAEGRGIYLVLWFGLEFKPVPRPPVGIKPPINVVDLEAALFQLLPDKEHVLLEAVILDCSRR